MMKTKNKILVGVAAGLLTMGQSFAAAPLAGAQILGTYNGDGSSIYGADFLQTSEGVQNLTGLAAFEGAEFITADSLIQINFNSAGLVTFTLDNASSAPASFVFDFGSSLTSLISAFNITDMSAVTSGAPVLSVINDHQISANLSSAVGSASGYSFTSQLVFTSAVPEPVAPAMLLAGLGIVGLISRKRRS
ncbi:PEP-CTERM sorting domain-containing protein [Uliginosibacterium sp. H3]|uniref:PEP-CTERM sorting domain-containing protein n=1 Tax=Uliginosibacterium silvisoli TaxID=3114758 RepID=A0ABU6K2Y5_9RHOO|nr:PEP-CTERM sorting domain-containing protein [Uliginosibacterium sp. H3]MEC5386289.1 PEP-CTERM sorting domain-containing protein [Uliginosibacterium sp. H3]